MKRFVFALFTFTALLILPVACIFSDNEQKEKKVIIETSMGKIKVKLYNNTPLHRDNFLDLVKNDFYDGLLFHRVINDFMIQTGDPATGNNPSSSETENHGPGYTISSEFDSTLFHKKGALAAAREGDNVNPDKRSSGSQFYIVQGKPFTVDELDDLEKKINNQKKQNLFFKYINEEKERAMDKGENIDYGKIQKAATLRLHKELKNTSLFSISEKHRKIYKSIGGTPHLDGSYTVFGEVIEGLEVIDKIAAVETNEKDKPVKDVYIIKMRIARDWF